MKPKTSKRDQIITELVEYDAQMVALVVSMAKERITSYADKTDEQLEEIYRSMTSEYYTPTDETVH